MKRASMVKARTVQYIPVTQRVLSILVRVGLLRTSEMLRNVLMMTGSVMLPVVATTVTGKAGMVGSSDSRLQADGCRLAEEVRCYLVELCPWLA